MNERTVHMVEHTRPHTHQPLTAREKVGPKQPINDRELVLFCLVKIDERLHLEHLHEGMRLWQGKEG